MYKIGENELVQCPYNRYHVISNLKIQQHIIKCKKNHPEVKLATCFFNYTHRLKPEDMLEHYEICPFKGRVEGSRYYDHPCSSSVKSGLENFSLTDSLKSQSLLRDVKQCQSFTKSDGNSIFNKSLEILNEENLSKLDSLNLVEEDDELEPLPLPKTTSKAFTNPKQDSSGLSSITSSQIKGFGRGKNILCKSTPKSPRSTDHLLPDLSDVESENPKRETTSKYFVRDMNASCSEFSEVFDDCTTLKSEEIIFDDDDDDDGFILKDFDKYRKI